MSPASGTHFASIRASHQYEAPLMSANRRALTVVPGCFSKAYHSLAAQNVFKSCSFEIVGLKAVVEW